MLEQTGSAGLLVGVAPLEKRVAHTSCERASWVFKGRGSILRFQPLLAKLAERSGLTGEANSLDYFLSTPDAIKKVPYLLLIGNASASTWNENTGAGLEGAVLLFEYRTRLRGTRVLSTADSTGRRNVLATPDSRARIAAFAARKLLQNGAQVVRIAFSETHRGTTARGQYQDHFVFPAAGECASSIAAEFRHGSSRRHGQWTFSEEEAPLYLPLLEDFDKTRARIGQRTRSNLRYYRRRAEQDLGASFVPKVNISLPEFLRFNAECTYAVPAELATWRYHSLRSLAHSALSGVRDRDGRWLSLVGMRRNGRYVELDWQMNRAHMPTASLATVMRSYLIEHEIRLGNTRLYIEGGTPQPIGFSFLKERVGELIVKKRSLYVAALERSASRVFPAKNRLAQCLGNPSVKWTDW